MREKTEWPQCLSRRYHPATTASPSRLTTPVSTAGTVPRNASARIPEQLPITVTMQYELARVGITRRANEGSHALVESSREGKILITSHMAESVRGIPLGCKGRMA
jgi:hypothetical protein